MDWTKSIATEVATGERDMYTPPKEPVRTEPEDAIEND